MLEGAQGYEPFTRITDISRHEDVKKAVAETVERFGRIDILVNNAGVIRDNLLFKMSDSDWDTVMDVHLKGAFLMSREVQTFMVHQKHGRIINLSSTSALGNRGQANYSTAKAGLQGLTKTLAVELGPYGITVNAVAPGFIETDMTRQTTQSKLSCIERGNGSEGKHPLREGCRSYQTVKPTVQGAGRGTDPTAR